MASTRDAERQVLTFGCVVASLLAAAATLLAHRIVRPLQTLSGVIEGIAEAEKRSVRFGEPTALELPSSISKFDVIMSALSNSVCPYLSHCSYNTNAHLQDTPQAPTYTALTTESDKRRCMN